MSYLSTLLVSLALELNSEGSIYDWAHACPIAAKEAGRRGSREGGFKI